MSDLKNINIHPVLFETNRKINNKEILPAQDREFRDNFVDRRLPSVAALEEYNSERSSLINDVNAKQGKLYYEKGKKPVSYFKDSLRGIHNCDMFSKMYYSQKNMTNLQNQIIYNVHKETGDVISRQHDNELLIVMRSTYLQHSKNPILDDLSNPKQVNAVKSEIQRLNNIVLDYIIPDIVSQILQYKRYIVDITQNYVPIPRETNPSIKGTKEFRDIKEVMNLSSA